MDGVLIDLQPAKRQMAGFRVGSKLLKWTTTGSDLCQRNIHGNFDVARVMLTSQTANARRWSCSTIMTMTVGKFIETAPFKMSAVKAKRLL